MLKRSPAGVAAGVDVGVAAGVGETGGVGEPGGVACKVVVEAPVKLCRHNATQA